MYIERKKIVKVEEFDEFPYENIYFYKKKEIKLFGFILKQGYSYYSTYNNHDDINIKNYEKAQTPEDYFNNFWSNSSKVNKFIKDGKIFHKAGINIYLINGDRVMKTFDSISERNKYLDSFVISLNNSIDNDKFIKI